jgi:hypothetical protein
MDITAFKASVEKDKPPGGLGRPLQALWHVAKGDWDRAHKLAQEEENETGAWVHAHLHRVEGDENNAGYWYKRANKPHSKAKLDDEWREIASALL